MIVRPTVDDMNPYYLPYVDLAPHGEVLAELRRSGEALVEAYRDFSTQDLHFRYEPGKWSVQELLGHLTDVERLFGARALAFARGETTSLPGFDEDDYVREGRFDERPVEGLLSEFSALREANLRMFESLPPAVLARRGVANGSPMVVSAVPWVLLGHQIHHQGVLDQRYRPQLPR